MSNKINNYDLCAYIMPFKVPNEHIIRVVYVRHNQALIKDYFFDAEVNNEPFEYPFKGAIIKTLQIAKHKKGKNICFWVYESGTSKVLELGSNPTTIDELKFRKKVDEYGKIINITIKELKQKEIREEFPY